MDFFIYVSTILKLMLLKGEFAKVHIHGLFAPAVS